MKMRQIFLAMAILLIPISASFAAKGASEQAYEHANDKAIFNRVGDWFATVGKSKEEKAGIKAERKAKRVEKAAMKEAGKAEKKIQKKMNKPNEGLDRSKRNISAEARKVEKKMKGSKKK